MSSNPLVKAITVSILSVFATVSFACTDIVVRAQDDSIVVGRTMEFGPDLNSQVISSPRERQFVTKTPDNQQGVSWSAKYGYVLLDFFGSGLTVDGLNEEGLAFGYLYLPGYTQYQSIPDGKNSQALPYLYFGDWILSNFATVAQVKAAVNDIYVYATPMTIAGHDNVVFPLHAVITDSTGASITIEFNHGEMQVYDNSLGVLTNSPTFPWHVNNVKNYVNLSPYASNPVTINGVVYESTGQGSGSVGLPGDYSPPSRFIKMSYLLGSVMPAASSAQALNLAQHILNNVDIPLGAVRGAKNTQEPDDRTQWTVFKDLQDKVLYFKSYDNTTLQAIDLKKINLQPGASQSSMPVTREQMVMDVTAKFSDSVK